MDTPRSIEQLSKLRVSNMTDSENIIMLNCLIQLIHDVVRDPNNTDDIIAGQFKDVYNFLRYSTQCLLDFTRNRMTMTELIDYLDLCKDGDSHFMWHCEDNGCKNQ